MLLQQCCFACLVECLAWCLCCPVHACAVFFRGFACVLVCFLLNLCSLGVPLAGSGFPRCMATASIPNALACLSYIYSLPYLCAMPSRNFKRGLSSSDLCFSRNFCHLYHSTNQPGQRVFREVFRTQTGFWLRSEVLTRLVHGKPCAYTLDCATAVSRFFNVPLNSLLFEDLSSRSALFL